MLYLALLHYPVYNKKGEVVTTAIANMDIHDIARIAKTYAANAFYIVNPVEGQRSLAREIVGHWRNGYGADYNKFRKHAFELINIKASLKEVVEDITRQTGVMPKSIVTGANFSGEVLKFSDLRKMLKTGDIPYLLIFGTGSGIADELINSCDFQLEQIKGVSGYNHLAVRSAVAIIMDKIMGV
ncbi:MAG: RNA methyltransferase [Syntrophaceae bacterium]|nr:RNA methyltransferase [Syntrophaceae bacterium]